MYFASEKTEHVQDQHLGLGDVPQVEKDDSSIEQTSFLNIVQDSFDQRTFADSRKANDCDEALQVGQNVLDDFERVVLATKEGCGWRR